MNRAGKHLNMDQLQVFIAVAAGFMLAALFLELLPENIEQFEAGIGSFFKWALVGMGLVVVFERYGVPRLKFVERFFHSDHAALSNVDLHDESIHHSHDHHHHHHNLKEAENCELSHEHGHLHTHTHMEVIGHGEVCSAIACFMICSFFDGMALSSIQAVDAKLGALIVIGVVLHLLPEGILSGAMALAGGASLKAASKVFYFIGGAFVLGAIIPYFWKGMESTFLALSCGVLLFVTLVQLVPTALKLKRAPLWMGLGALTFLLSEWLLSTIGIGGHSA
jgi:zinc transporter ZupT